MTEQELRQELGEAIKSAGIPEGQVAFDLKQRILVAAKAYADARVAQECKVLDEVVTLLHQTIANRNVEIAELKAESKYWNERWEAGNKFQDAAFNSEIENYHEVKRLNAEIKRLRDGIQKVADHLWVREPRNMSWLELRDQVSILHGLLSPAPVTETPLPKLIRSDALPPNNFMGMGDEGKPFIGEISTGISPKNEDQE